jgi:hypothetical protein
MKKEGVSKWMIYKKKKILKSGWNLEKGVLKERVISVGVEIFSDVMRTLKIGVIFGML